MKNLKGYTLNEILIVLALASALLLLNLGVAFSLTKGFVNSIAARSLTDFIINSRHFSTLNPGQPGEYTFAAGVLLKMQDGVLFAYRVKYSITSSLFYIPFMPNNIIHTNIHTLGSSKGDNINVFSFLRKAQVQFLTNNTPLTCDGYLILYDKLLAKRYAYCQNATTYTPIAGDLILQIEHVPFNIIISQDGQIYTRYDNN